MKVFQSYSEFAAAYLQQRHSLGFQLWTVINVHALDENDKQAITSVRIPLHSSASLILLAHTTDRITESVLVIDAHKTSEMLATECFSSYVDDVAHRIVGVNPAQMDGFFEYETWDEFKDIWLLHEGKPVIPHITPLLFDLPTDLEYLAWQKSGALLLNYRRLIVTLYGVKKNAFYTIFVKQATQQEIEHYVLLVRAQKGMAAAWA